MRTQKEIVRLRSRDISGDQQSLYLDIYLEGKRTYEYLHLYLLPETNRQNKDKNRETMQLAEAIKSKRLVEIQNGVYGFEKNELSKTPFLEYVRKYIQEKDCAETTRTDFNSILKHLEKYSNEKTTFADIDVNWVEGFKKYLTKASKLNQKDCSEDGEEKTNLLSPNTRRTYIAKLLTMLRKAHKDKIIRYDIADEISNFDEEESERVFLTPDEVRLLAATDCSNVTRRAFLFSCLTGLRMSDVMKLRWEQVSTVNGFTRITFSQHKTKGLMYQDINEQAVKYMGIRKRSGLVFRGFVYSSYTSVYLQRWALSVGISKEITYHSSRHTFVLMLLDSGIDFYTVSKLVGHKSIQTTLRYSHILDSKKRQAVLSIPDINNTTNNK